MTTFQCLVTCIPCHLMYAVTYSSVYSLYNIGLALCRIPTGGMFVWVDILGVTDSVPIVQRLHERGLIVVAGKFFRADQRPSNGIRVSVSSEPEHRMDKVSGNFPDP